MKYLVVAAALVLAGCQSEVMEARFRDSKVLLMTDQNGNQYVARHLSSDSYAIHPIEQAGK